MVDQCTSWPIAIAIPDKEATTVANAINKDLILQHGAPEILLSVNGKEFCNDTLAYVCQEYGIAQHFTSPYKPRSNGKTENFNKFLKASFRKLCQADKCFMGSSIWSDPIFIQVLLSHLHWWSTIHIAFTLEIYLYPFTNWSNLWNHTRVIIPLVSKLNSQELLYL